MESSNNTIKKKNKYVVRIHFSFWIIMLTVFLTYFSPNNGSYGLEYMILGAILVCLNPGILNEIIPTLICCMVSLFLLVISGKMGELDFNAPIFHSLKFVYLLYVHIMAVTMRRFSQKEKRYIIICSLGAVAVSSVISIYCALFQDIYAMRYFEERGFYQVLDFNQLYSVVFLILIVFFYYMKTKRTSKKTMVCGVFLILTVFCVGISLYVTAVLLLGMGLVLTVIFWIYEKNQRRFVILLLSGIVFVLLLFAFSGVVSDFIYDITADMNWIVRDRIRSVVDTVFRTDHSLSYSYDRRNELSGYSINTFKENVLFGCGYKNFGYGVIGCHQEWPDMLGVFGLFGMSIFLGIMYNMVKKTYVRVKNGIEKGMFLVCLALFAILGFLNPCLNLPVLIAMFLIAPNMGAFPDKKVLRRKYGKNISRNGRL